jgi:hypothetical protein
LLDHAYGAALSTARFNNDGEPSSRDERSRVQDVSTNSSATEPLIASAGVDDDCGEVSP